MNKPSISTIIVIICLLIVGLYAMGEVNYFSTKVAVEKSVNVDSPKIIIPSIGVDERINMETLDYGVLSDPAENIPTEHSVALYGHRTLQGSPFLRLNELGIGDTFILEWPGIGELKYKVTDTKIVPATYDFSPEGANSTYLITCDPIGSTENRIIVQGDLIEKGPVNVQVMENNPQESNALIITAIFLVVGIVFSFFYPKDTRIYILATVLIISAVLFYCCINPMPSEWIYDKIIFLNGGSGWI